jgi:hypothetical protein
MSDKIFRPLVCALLACILGAQVYSVIYTAQNKPITYGDLTNAKQADQKKQLLLKVPVIDARINDVVTVEISNDPLPVTIER